MIESVEALVATIANQLIARGEFLAVAETAAGGRISDLFTGQAGCSAWYAGGIVVYSAASKRDLTGLSAETLQEHGAVSSETALALAAGVRRYFDTAWGIGETGIAGPQTGRRSSKPAGLAYVAVVGPDAIARTAEINTGRDSRSENKQQFAVAALRLLAESLGAA